MPDLRYFYDVGTACSSDQAMYWYRRAYRQGDAAGASNVAVFYREQGQYRLPSPGTPVPQISEMAHH